MDNRKFALLCIILSYQKEFMDNSLFSNEIVGAPQTPGRMPIKGKGLYAQAINGCRLN